MKAKGIGLLNQIQSSEFLLGLHLMEANFENIF